MRGKQITKTHEAPLTAAEVATAPANTLGAYLKNIAGAGSPRTVLLACKVATADGSKSSDTKLPSKPLSLPVVVLNGETLGFVGDAVKTKAFYISADGAAARALADMAVDDYLFVNPSILGYPLDATDTIYLQYQA